ncbi:RecBCD enzyme subunit RecD [Planctomycetales bacterium]|nr:RecBCD enzyme subunit RecD [Planctomycetales bacterium]GHT00966.1 RecBCD enzyme subunit RecD [Planctomycetales bacterium]
MTHQRPTPSPFARHFAAVVARLAPVGASVGEEFQRLVALVARATCDDNHVCLPLNKLKNFFTDDALLAVDWSRRLREDDYAFAVAVAEAAPPRNDLCKPLVLDGDRLYLQRYWLLERQLAERLNYRPAQPDASAVSAASAATWDAAAIRALTKLPLDDEQVVAVRRALTEPFCVITGAPGAGKTTIIGVVLAALVGEQWAVNSKQTTTNHQLPTINCRLVAPTGKAQARMQEALKDEIRQNINVGDAVKNFLTNLETATIHRLLKYQPSRRAFAHTAENPFAADCLIVDECSMVDLPLMASLLAATPPACRVVLLGDRDQLAAVETGAVFADICAAWQNSPRVARLEKSHRFDGTRGIGKLKDAVNRGDGDAAWQILTSGDATLSSAPAPKTVGELERRLGRAGDYWGESGDLADAFAQFDRFRILCATHGGVGGVETVNRLLPKILGVKKYGRGYPVLITENDYRRRLFNGDTGLCEDDGGVYFPAAEKFRRFSVAELPAHTAAWALTTHQAQGSGFDEVWLILPARSLPLLTREWLYTGLTRAKKRCVIWADEAVFKAAVAAATARDSGLAERLGRKV